MRYSLRLIVQFITFRFKRWSVFINPVFNQMGIHIQKANIQKTKVYRLCLAIVLNIKEPSKLRGGLFSLL